MYVPGVCILVIRFAKVVILSAFEIECTAEVEASTTISTGLNELLLVFMASIS